MMKICFSTILNNLIVFYKKMPLLSGIFICIITIKKLFGNNQPKSITMDVYNFEVAIFF